MIYDFSEVHEQPSRSRILLVEDDNKLALLVKEFLEINGLEVAIEPRGDHAVSRILDEQPDLIVLDLMLPGLDGLSICKQIRPQYQGPILMLTARGEEVDEVVGLELGADDYVAKPVRPRVLLARINNLLRRSSLAIHEATPTSSPSMNGSPALSAPLEIGSLMIDATNRVVRMRGEIVELTTAEFDLLWLLARNAGKILSREYIYTELRGIAYDGLDRSIDLRITRLRRKLGDEGKQPRIIKSIRGEGYLLVLNP